MPGPTTEPVRMAHHTREVMKRSPVEVALASEGYCNARKDGPIAQARFLTNLLERPSVSRSPRYQTEVLTELVYIHCIHRNESSAVAAARTLLTHEFEFAHDAYYVAKWLFETFGTADPTLSLIEYGYTLVDKPRGMHEIHYHDVLTLAHLELSVRAITKTGDSGERLRDLAIRIYQLEDKGIFVSPFIVPTAKALIAKGVSNDAIISLVEQQLGQSYRLSRSRASSNMELDHEMESILTEVKRGSSDRDTT